MTISDVKTEELLVDALFSDSVREKHILESGAAREVVKLTGDASSRIYYRVFCDEKTYVACLDQSLIELDSAENVDFYLAQKLLKKEGVRVPEIYHVEISKGYILQEDLGDETLLKHLSTMRGLDEEYLCYREIIDELLKIHLIKASDYGALPFFKRSFDYEKLFFEVNFTMKYLIEGLFKSEAESLKSEILRCEFSKIIAEIAKERKVLSHRDFHSRNIMFKEDSFKIIDFQDMRMGIAQYDLVSLLEDCYYRVHEKNKENLKKYYWERAREKKIEVLSYEEFLQNYDKMAIQRTFKALGNFGYIYQMRKDIRYLKYIGYAFEQLRHILFNYKEYDLLRSTLSEIYYEY